MHLSICMFACLHTVCIFHLYRYLAPCIVQHCFMQGIIVGFAFVHDAWHSIGTRYPVVIMQWYSLVCPLVFISDSRLQSMMRCTSASLIIRSLWPKLAQTNVTYRNAASHHMFRHKSAAQQHNVYCTRNNIK